MNWTHIKSATQLEQIDKESEIQAVLIYKHSHRCHVCTLTLRNLEKKWNDTYDTSLKPYFVDVIAGREISRQIAERYGVSHESPQALVIIKRKCVMHQSHGEISLNELLEKSAAA